MARHGSPVVHLDDRYGPAAGDDVEDGGTAEPSPARGSVIVPRPVVVLIVIVLTVLLAADVFAQFIVPGHTASPVIDGAILAVLGGVVAGSRGPKPAEPPAPPASPPPPEPPAIPDTGRHRVPGEDT